MSWTLKDIARIWLPPEDPEPQQVALDSILAELPAAANSGVAAMRQVGAPDEGVVDATQEHRALNPSNRRLVRGRGLVPFAPPFSASTDEPGVGAGGTNQATERQGLSEKDVARLHALNLTGHGVQGSSPFEPHSRSIFDRTGRLPRPVSERAGRPKRPA